MFQFCKYNYREKKMIRKRFIKMLIILLLGGEKFYFYFKKKFLQFLLVCIIVKNKNEQKKKLYQDFLKILNNIYWDFFFKIYIYCRKFEYQIRVEKLFRVKLLLI